MKISNEESLEWGFDELMFQLGKGNTFEKLDKDIRYQAFEQVTEWKSKFGFKFNIYSNDHLIEGQPHFHFDNKSEGISAKCSFNGELLEEKSKIPIPKKVIKALKYFLLKPKQQESLISIWNSKNPKLKC